jgi:hypothetical protein
VRHSHTSPAVRCDKVDFSVTIPADTRASCRESPVSAHPFSSMPSKFNERDALSPLSRPFCGAFFVTRSKTGGLLGFQSWCRFSITSMETPDVFLPAPRGGAWKVNTIYGNAGRGTGILNIQLYAGTRVWNRLNYRKDPETDKRVSRKRDEAELLTCDVPELRIIEPALWDAVKARQGTQRKTLKKSAPVALRRKKYLLSGLVQCGKCGGNMTVAGTGARRAYYCANAKEKGATVCTGLPGIHIDKLQPLVLAGLRDELMMPEAVARFSEEYRRHIVEVNQTRHEETAVLRHAIAQQQKSINGCLRAFRDDRAKERIYDMLVEAEATKKELTARAVGCVIFHIWGLYWEGDCRCASRPGLLPRVWNVVRLCYCCLLWRVAPP